MTRADHQIDVAINKWLEAHAKIRVGSVSAQLEQYARLGCRPQSSTRNRDPKWVGLRSAERPLGHLNRRELLALALRYSGPTLAQSALQDGWLVEWNIKTMVPYQAVNAYLGCSPDAARGVIERARRKVGAALVEQQAA